ncbi:toxic protein SymE [Erwinia toletana]|uniref:Toxic protein SymE n=2 Tax=Winslowiella toletana TaxID=92490 RepID=A0ABS4P8P0_9GAMM|nr:toxic protein SymE [Winslowiella toletana]
MRRHPDFTQISSLTLKGHWLAAAGFPIGTEVDIRVMSGCLVITPRKSDLDEPEFIHSLRKLSARKQRQVEEYIGLVASNGS